MKSRGSRDTERPGIRCNLIQPSGFIDRRLPALAFLLFCFGLNEWAVGPVLTVFVLPAGYLAAWLLGSWPTVSSEGVSFFLGGTRFAVTGACSGVVFFGLVSALGILFIRSIPRFLLILPLVYLFAVAANTVRILCWAAAFPVLHRTVPGGLLDAGHEIAGAIVYLPAALFAHWLFHRVSDSSPDHPPGEGPLETGLSPSLSTPDQP